MKPWDALHAGHVVIRSQRLSAEALAALQDKKLRHIIGYACRHVSYYQKMFSENGLSERDIRGVADLAKLPISTKDDFKCVPDGQLVSADPHLGPLREERSSGSSGVPFSVQMDRHYLLTRNLRFMRGLTTVGYRWPMRLLLITADVHKKAPPPVLRWKYLSEMADAAELYRGLKDFGPRVLYGSASPLRLLAEYILRNELKIRSLEAVVSTAETLDGGTRRLLEDAFRSQVFDFYGMTELGLIAWQCPARAGYHLAEDALIVEMVPLEDEHDCLQLVYTNLDLRGMPLIRYASGDIGFGLTREPCVCGRTLSRLQRIEGRLIDLLTLRDGRRVSPYQLTDRLDMVEGVYRYKVVQEDLAHLVVMVKGDGLRNSQVAQNVRSVVRDVLGDGIHVRVTMTDNIPKGQSRKFRLVESYIDRTTSASGFRR